MSQLTYPKIKTVLSESLSDFDYVLLTPFAGQRVPDTLKIGLPSKDRRTFLQVLETTLDFQVVHSKLDRTILTVERDSEAFLTIELYHFFHEGRLAYLSMEELLESRRRDAQNWFVPDWDHLLEFTILNSFFEETGLTDDFVRQFDDLHVFLQEGLMDFFNQKYDTYFTGLDELTEHRETIENHFRKQLRQFPANKLSNRLRLGWTNVKQFLKRSAVY